MTMPLKNGAEAGFTLLEVIVAFAIMALVLGVSIGVFSTGLRNATTAGGYAGAVVRGEGKLALVGVAERLEPGSTTGRFDRDYAWRLDIRTAARQEGAIEGADAHPLYAVALTVSWGNGRHARQLTLRTYRLKERRMR